MKRRLAVITVAVVGLIGSSAGSALALGPSPEGDHGSRCANSSQPEAIACIASLD